MRKGSACRQGYLHLGRSRAVQPRLSADAMEAGNRLHTRTFVSRRVAPLRLVAAGHVSRQQAAAVVSLQARRRRENDIINIRSRLLLLCTRMASIAWAGRRVTCA